MPGGIAEALQILSTDEPARHRARAMSFMEALEAAWELIASLFALIGAILKGIWNAILGLFGWN